MKRPAAQIGYVTRPRDSPSTSLQPHFNPDMSKGKGYTSRTISSLDFFFIPKIFTVEALRIMFVLFRRCKYPDKSCLSDWSQLEPSILLQGRARTNIALHILEYALVINSSLHKTSCRVFRRKILEATFLSSPNSLKIKNSIRHTFNQFVTRVWYTSNAQCLGKLRNEVNYHVHEYLQFVLGFEGRLTLDRDVITLVGTWRH